MSAQRNFFNSKSRVEKRFSSMQEGIEHTLLRGREKVLLSDDEVKMTGADVADKAARLARAIVAVTPEGGRVGLLMPNSAAKGLAFLAVFIAKRVPVMLNGAKNYLDAAKAISGMNLHALVTNPGGVPNDRLIMPTLYLDSRGEVRETFADAVAQVSCMPSPGTSLILYTSGSSGEPKGVQLAESSLLYNVEFLMDYLDLDESSVAPLLLPVCHTMALNTQFLPVFFAGGSSVFFESSYSLGRIYRNILDCEGSCVALISDLVRLCHEEMTRKNLGPALHVRQVTLAGGMIRSHHLEMAKELFPNAVLFKGYGLTEAIRVSMIDSRDPHFVNNSAGYILPDQTIEIRDDDDQLVPPGHVGHVYVKGPNVMVGYDNGKSSPIEADGFLKTYDMGSLGEDGRLVIHGRSDGIVKVRGKRVALKEVEDAAMSLLPEIKDAKCLALPSNRSELSLVLYLELGDQSARAHRPDFRELIDIGLRKKIKDHHSLPKDIFVLSRFPRTPNGKIQSYMLKEMWASRERFLRFDARGETHRLRFFTETESPHLLRAHASAPAASL